MTVCVKARKCIFGKVIDNEMALNDVGRMVESIWIDIPKHYSGVDIDAFITMPNHIHGILILSVGAGPRACPDEKQRMVQPQWVAHAISLPGVVQRFKSLTTTKYIKGAAQNHWLPFQGRLWQRNYYEHVVRNENELNSIREYIELNPTKWAFDRENPEHSPRTRALGSQKEIEEILGCLP